MDKKKGGRPKKEFDEKDWKILENAILFGNEDYCANQLNISASVIGLLVTFKTLYVIFLVKSKTITELGFE